MTSLAPPEPAPPGGHATIAPEVRAQVRAVGLVLLVLGALIALWTLQGMLQRPDMDEVEKVLGRGAIPEEVKAVLRTLMGTGVRVLLGLFGLCLGGLIALGGAKMRALQAWPLAVAGCVLALLPCSGCCCLTFPAGAFGLYLLLLPGVRPAFT